MVLISTALEPAITREDRATILRDVALAEPRKPRVINRAIQTQLETIILKAMAKDPSERYLTSGDLAADLQRFASDRPIHAKPPNMVERIARWSRRQLVVAAVAVVLVILTVASSVTAVMVTNALRREQAARKQADELLESQISLTKQARLSIDQYVEAVKSYKFLNHPDAADIRFELLRFAYDIYENLTEQIRLSDSKSQLGDTLLRLEQDTGTDFTGKSLDTNAVGGLNVQPDGKILIGGGRSEAFGSTDHEMYVARFFPDGTLDKSFNGIAYNIIELDPASYYYGGETSFLVLATMAFTVTKGNPEVQSICRWIVKAGCF